MNLWKQWLQQPQRVWLRRALFQIHLWTGLALGVYLVVLWTVRLHDELLYGPSGRFWNGVASAFVTLLCVTGAIVWWPGVNRWRRSLIVKSGGGWRRFSWDLHSAMGAWLFLFILMWG